MNLIKNLSFRKKLLTLIMPPILGAILFAGVSLNSALNDKNIVEQIRPLVNLSISGSLMVHELQKERGATAGYVGSKGMLFKETLKKQRHLSDTVLERETQFINTLNEYLSINQPETYQELTQIMK